MSSKPTDKISSNSMFAKHSALYGVNTGVDYLGTKEELDLEASHLEKIVTPPLTLPKTPKKPIKLPMQWIGLAMAASIAGLTFFNFELREQNKIDDLTPKGTSSKLEVFYKRNSKVMALMPNDTLQENDEIRVAYTSDKSGKAALLFTSADTTIPLSGAWSKESFIAVTSGQTLEFPGSARLTGTNTGEGLAVLHCFEKAVANASALKLEEIHRILRGDTNQDLKNRGLNCSVTTRTLR